MSTPFSKTAASRSCGSTITVVFFAPIIALTKDSEVNSKYPVNTSSGRNTATHRRLKQSCNVAPAKALLKFSLSDFQLEII